MGEISKVILLAEDSQDDEWLFKLVLERSQIEQPVMVVRHGGEAIAYLEGKDEFADRGKYPLPGILFLDLKMPVIDGFEVLEWLRRHPAVRKDLLVIVLTQFGDARQLRRAYDLGANTFLHKPFTVEDMKNLMRHFDGHWMQSHAPVDNQTD